jgi:Tol biopolymer transport system component
VQGDYSSREARFSPDGQYVAYDSSETGDFEIYVQTFPEHSGKWQVSSGGGRNPEWGRDGKELYFLSGGKLMAVDVNTGGPQFEAGIPKPLFEAPFPVGGVEHALYRVTADGQRFLAVTTSGQQANSPITVVINWPADLKP